MALLLSNYSVSRNTSQEKLVKYRNQTIDMHCKYNDWFLYDKTLSEKYSQTDYSCYFFTTKN